LLRTAVFSALIAVGFTFLSFIMGTHELSQWLDPHEWLVTYGRTLVVALVIGYITHGLYTLGDKFLGRRRIEVMKAWERTLFFAGLPLLGVAIGWPIGVTLIFGDLHVLRSLGGADILTLIVIALTVNAMLSTFFSLRIKRIRAEMRANEAQLRLLQGQMEPHFLFNTLANVISLIDADAPRAKLMLEALTDYLRASLGGLRHGDSTLATELDLARRYLQLMQTRMGDRLRFEFKADSALQQATLMPLVLQPLIENAVKHGLEPKVDGGTVRVTVARLSVDGADALQVCVEDDGAGLAAAAHRPRRRVAGGADGNGIALANLRERLESRFGPRAQLTLTDLEAEGRTGTRACLVVPWNVATPAAA
jgi:LytS/YehU family sensor histidine kinase